MLLSVFTPTHKVDHLPEALRSLEHQGEVNWEWVLVPNGDAIAELPPRIASHPRVRVVPYKLDQGETPKIGALKRFACENCRGDVFIELDHDDMLMPGVLGQIAKQVDNKAGFIYSDAAVFRQKGQHIAPTSYSEQYGWETYELRIYGHDLMATRSFDATPRSLCEIYYAPDHVRAWTREAYYLAGGHDNRMTVGDDHDLVCRTYLAGVKFAHTGSCGYLYRNHPGNTVKSHNRQIQKQQSKNRDTYFFRLVDEWLRRRGLRHIDMSEHRSRVSLDDEGNLSLRADDNSIGLIRCYDWINQVPSDKYIQFWSEIYRVLVPGGWMHVRAPSTSGQGGFQPHFKSYWNEFNFNFISSWPHSRDLGIRIPPARFQLVRCWTEFPDSHYKQCNFSYVYADLCALKGQRQPGFVRI